MLVERSDVNPDTASTENDQTSLSLAAKNGRGGVVRMLLEWNDANLDRADTRRGRTPLSWTAGMGMRGL